MFNTSCVNAGVPVLLVVQFPRDGTGSFPTHLVNTKTEECYSQWKWWSFISSRKYHGIRKGEGCFWKVTEVRLKQIAQTYHEKCKKQPNLCTNNSPYTHSPSIAGLWEVKYHGDICKWIDYWTTAWLPVPCPLLPWSVTSRNHSITHFLSLIKWCCSTFVKYFDSVYEKFHVRTKASFSLNGNISSLHAQSTVGETKPQSLQQKTRWLQGSAVLTFVTVNIWLWQSQLLQL